MYRLQCQGGSPFNTGPFHSFSTAFKFMISNNGFLGKKAQQTVI